MPSGSMTIARMLLACAVCGLVSCARDAALRVHFIDVGYGDAILLHDGAGHAILIDGGSGAHEDDHGRLTVLPYLHTLGITQLDAVICTHSHPDHAGGLVDVVRTLPVLQFIRPAWRVTNVYTVALDELCAARGVPVSHAARGDTWRWGALTLAAVHPPHGGADIEAPPVDLNATSLALDVQYGLARALLLADITAPVLAELHGLQLLPRAALLKIPHHGLADAFDMERLAAIAPRHAVLTIGPNPYGAPAPAVVAAYEQLCILWRTDRDGTIIAELTARGALAVVPWSR